MHAHRCLSSKDFGLNSSFINLEMLVFLNNFKRLGQQFVSQLLELYISGVVCFCCRHDVIKVRLLSLM